MNWSDQLYVFVPSNKESLFYSDFNHGKVMLVYNLKNNNIDSWEKYHYVNLIEEEFISEGEGIVELVVDIIYNNKVWIATTTGKLLTFTKNYDNVDSIPLSLEGDLTLNSDFYSEDTFRSVKLMPQPNLKGLGISYNHGVYKIRSCGEALLCAEDASNQYFGCWKGWYLNTLPYICSQCDSSCTDCNESSTKCTECPDKYEVSVSDYSCECKAEYTSLTKPGCCNILNGELFTDEGTCQKCQNGCLKCVNDGESERCFDDLIFEI